MAQTYELVAKLKTDNSDFNSGMKSAVAETENFSQRMTTMGKNMSTGVAIASAAVVAGVTAAFKGAFDAATESAQIGRETERVIKTTGGAAGVTAKQIGDLATSISNLTGKDDEMIQSGANLLLTFTNVKNKVGENNDVFNQATKLALDMSVALGTDMNGASLQLGKALNDPIKGITALSRAGVSFTADQKDMIKSMVENGDTLGAQKIILKELATEFGGAAEAAKTPMETLTTKIDNVKESVGRALMPAVGGAVGVLGNLADAFLALPGPIQAVFGVGGGLTIGLMAIGPVFVKMWEFASPVFDALKGGFKIVADGMGNFAEKMSGGKIASEGFSSTLSSGLGTALPIIGIAAVGAIGIFTLWNNQQKDAAERAKKFTETLDDETGAITKNTEKLIANNLAGDDSLSKLGKLGVSMTQIKTYLEDSTGKWVGENAAREAYFRTVGAGPEIMQKEITALRQAGGARNDMTAQIISGAQAAGIESDRVREILNLFGEEAVAYDKKQQAIHDVALGQALANGISAEAAEKEAQHAMAIQATIDALKAEHDNLRAMTDPYFGAMQSAQANAQAQRELNDTLKTHSVDSVEARAATDKAAKAALDYKGSLMDLKGAMAGGAGANELAGAMNGLKEFGFDPTTAAGQDLMNRMWEISAATGALDGSKVRIAMELDTRSTEGKIAWLKSQTDPDTGFIPFGAVMALSGLAGGGPVKANTPYLVGEKGPELFMSGVSGQIIPNNDLATISAQSLSSGSGDLGNSVGSSGSINVTINTVAGDPDAIERVVIDAIARASRRGATVLKP